jgi:hypothetical protein
MIIRKKFYTPKFGVLQHAREWPVEIRPLALRGRGFLLPFEFFGCLTVKFRILTDRYKI